MSDAVQSSPRFKISLRTLLISLIAIGTGAGLLGRLFLTNPQVFFVIIGALTTFVPYLFAIGTIIWVGIQSKRRGLVVWSVWLVLMPVIGAAVIFFGQRQVGNSPGDLAVQNTASLLAERLPKQVDEPWVWRELQRRITSGSLTAEQADKAIGVLVRRQLVLRFSDN